MDIEPQFSPRILVMGHASSELPCGRVRPAGILVAAGRRCFGLHSNRQI